MPNSLNGSPQRAEAHAGRNSGDGLYKVGIANKVGRDRADNDNRRCDIGAIEQPTLSGPDRMLV